MLKKTLTYLPIFRLSTILLLFAAAMAFFSTESAFGVVAPAEQKEDFLKDVSIAQQDDTYIFKITNDRTPTYTIYELFNPLRIIIDISKADLAQLGVLPIKFKQGPIVEVKGRLFDKRRPQIARLEVFLKDDRGYSARLKNNDIVLTFPVINSEIQQPVKENELANKQDPQPSPEAAAPQVENQASRGGQAKEPAPSGVARSSGTGPADAIRPEGELDSDISPANVAEDKTASLQAADNRTGMEASAKSLDNSKFYSDMLPDEMKLQVAAKSPHPPQPVSSDSGPALMAPDDNAAENAATTETIEETQPTAAEDRNNRTPNPAAVAPRPQITGSSTETQVASDISESITSPTIPSTDRNEKTVLSGAFANTGKTDNAGAASMQASMPVKEISGPPKKRHIDIQVIPLAKTEIQEEPLENTLPETQNAITDITSEPTDEDQFASHERPELDMIEADSVSIETVSKNKASAQPVKELKTNNKSKQRIISESGKLKPALVAHIDTQPKKKAVTPQYKEYPATSTAASTVQPEKKTETKHLLQPAAPRAVTDENASASAPPQKKESQAATANTAVQPAASQKSNLQPKPPVTAADTDETPKEKTTPTAEFAAEKQQTSEKIEPGLIHHGAMESLAADRATGTTTDAAAASGSGPPVAAKIQKHAEKPKPHVADNNSRMNRIADAGQTNTVPPRSSEPLPQAARQDVSGKPVQPQQKVEEVPLIATSERASRIVDKLTRPGDELFMTLKNFDDGVKDSPQAPMEKLEESRIPVPPAAAASSDESTAEETAKDFTMGIEESPTRTVRIPIRGYTTYTQRLPRVARLEDEQAGKEKQQQTTPRKVIMAKGVVFRISKD